METGTDLVKRDETHAIMKVSTVELVDGVEAIYKDVREAAEKILSFSKIQDLGEAAETLVTIQRKTSKLKLPIPSPGQFVLNRFLNQAKRMVSLASREIKKRQSVKKALEESRAFYALRRNALREGIEDIVAHAEKAAQTTAKLRQTIYILESEIDLLMQFRNSLEGKEVDKKELQALENAIRIRQTLLSDLHGAKLMNEATEADTNTQLQEREALYIKMGSMLPMLDTLTSQQLANLISRRPIKQATDAIQKGEKTLRELALQTSAQARQDAVATANALYNPIIDEETLNKVADNIIRMCDETRAAINDSIAKQQRVIITAKEASQRMQTRLENFNQGK